jgi:hypothetical protein
LARSQLVHAQLEHWLLAIRRIVIDSAKLKSLEIQDLTVKRLRVGDVTVSDSLKLPGSNVGPQILS